VRPYNAYERPLVERAAREATGPHPLDADSDVDFEPDDVDIPF
jgi:hypothetical protein